ncbi:MAG: SDR family NAD(P)-dependent oxidoreductase [Chlorobiaceae bacterium]|nr:SDR family NAD(P)-dependent oxidoreductase [Chlorobiaceae bacterium]
MSRKAIIVGATSGIALCLARLYIQNGWSLGLTGRNTERCKWLEGQFPSSTVTIEMELADADIARGQFDKLAGRMEGVDLVVIAAGTGHIDPELPWEKELETIATNVDGFAAIAHASIKLFERQGYGHLAAISSIAGIRGGGAPAYNASKAFVSNYLQGLRHHAYRSGKPIFVTDIQPGFVDTPMAKGDNLFWVAIPEKAAMQIYRALERRKRHCYVTRRWWLIAWALKLLPEPLYLRLS